MKEFLLAVSLAFAGTYLLTSSQRRNQANRKPEGKNDSFDQERDDSSEENNNTSDNMSKHHNCRREYNNHARTQSQQNSESKPSSVAIIYRSEMDFISRCIHDYPNIETGGQLFGFITETGSPVVCYAIGPGRNANHQVAFFNQDTEYLQSTYNELNRRYGLRYIGEWHSHHQLGLARPSGHDANTIINGIQRSNFRHFLLCIGNCDANYHSVLNAYTFHIDHLREFNHAPWKIIEMESPYRPIVDRELGNLICQPSYSHASYGNNYILSESGEAAMVTPSYNDNYWLNDKTNNLALKNIIDYLSSFKGCVFLVKPLLDSENHVHLVVQKEDITIRISFGQKFPQEPPMIVPSENLKYDRSAVWKYNGDIFESFKIYFESLFVGVSSNESQEKKELNNSDNQTESEIDNQTKM